MTWQSMESALRGYYETVKAGDRERQIFRKIWVHTWRRDGFRNESYWSPETGNWAGYAKGTEPDMWHPFPDSATTPTPTP